MNALILDDAFARPLAPARLPPVQAWRIHLGAHKTATTHLQQTLAEIRPRLVANGIDTIPLETMRRTGFAQMLTRRRPLARVPFLRGPLTRRLIGDLLEPLRQGPRTVVLSEEKLIGTPRRVFAEPAYPSIERIVPMLAGLGASADLTLFLSIRSFDAQLPSTYAQELRVMPPPEGGFAAIRARVRARPPSWFDLVVRIVRAAPGTPIRVWRQEDYRSHRRAITAALCGCDTGPLPDLPDPPRTKSPSAAAIAEAEALPHDLVPAMRRTIVDAIYAASDAGADRFAPFDAEDQAALHRAYAADLARIEALGPDVLLRF